MDESLFWHHPKISRADRERRNGHRGCIVWFTGLSGAGKSSLARALEAQLFEFGCRTLVFDGNNARQVYCRCPLEVCEQRDRKWIYQIARRGDIPEFTGISGRYEEPLRADLALDTGIFSIDDCLAALPKVMEVRSIVPARPVAPA